MTGVQTCALPIFSGLAKKAFLDGVDVVTFTSSSTVRNLVEMLDGDRAALEASFIACIGPVTSATARELGLRVDLEATKHTVEGPVDALISHFAPGELSRKYLSVPEEKNVITSFPDSRFRRLPGRGSLPNLPPQTPLSPTAFI